MTRWSTPSSWPTLAASLAVRRPWSAPPSLQTWADKKLCGGARKHWPLSPESWTEPGASEQLQDRWGWSITAVLPSLTTTCNTWHGLYLHCCLVFGVLDREQAGLDVCFLLLHPHGETTAEHSQHVWFKNKVQFRKWMILLACKNGTVTFPPVFCRR